MCAFWCVCVCVLVVFFHLVDACMWWLNAMDNEVGYPQSEERRKHNCVYLPQPAAILSCIFPLHPFVKRWNIKCYRLVPYLSLKRKHKHRFCLAIEADQHWNEASEFINISFHVSDACTFVPWQRPFPRLPLLWGKNVFLLLFGVLCTMHAHDPSHRQHDGVRNIAWQERRIRSAACVDSLHGAKVAALAQLPPRSTRHELRRLHRWITPTRVHCYKKGINPLTSYWGRVINPVCSYREEGRVSNSESN